MKTKIIKTDNPTVEYVTVNYITPEEVEKQNKKLEAKIKRLQTKHKKEILGLEEKYNKLKSKMWYFKEGDYCLWKGVYKVYITKLLDDKEYKYEGYVCKKVSSAIFSDELNIPELPYIKFRQEDLQTFNFSEEQYRNHLVRELLRRDGLL